MHLEYGLYCSLVQSRSNLPRPLKTRKLLILECAEAREKCRKGTSRHKSRHTRSCSGDAPFPTHTRRERPRQEGRSRKARFHRAIHGYCNQHTPKARRIGRKTFRSQNRFLA